MKVIMLIDMDYFFAACEELRNPGLKDKPVVVGADPKNGSGRGVVSTCNYIARKYGIRSGMPISMAYRLKNDAVFLPVDYDYYEKMSKSIMSILKGYASKFEQVSIDEAFIDVSDKVTVDSAEAYAMKIKDNIKSATGLPCSIGIGPNRIIAKMACEAAKPNGIKLVREEDAKQFLSGMPVEKLYGVGKKTAEKLKAMGYTKIEDIAKANRVQLINSFGIFGRELQESANGIGSDEIIENYETKSIGRERTFEQDTSDISKMGEVIDSMAKEVEEEIKAQGFYFKTVTLKLRYSNFDEHLKSKSLSHYSNSLSDIVSISKLLLVENRIPEMQVRKIGVRVSNLIKRKGQRKLSDYIN